MSALSNLFQDIADAIRDKTGGTDKMNPAAFPAAIAGIEAGGNADVRYVTFLNYDGTELGKKAVAVGDDCADPITRGVFSKPTRPSDVQYNYTFSGWATEQGGAVNSSALKTVNDDRTLYAVYSSAVRYYTITYYDSNGTTVLKTESLAYGTMPAYIPNKTGYGFNGWVPALATVTGNASYTAEWAEKLTFANASWEDIAQVSASGEAASTFAIGDAKQLVLTAEDGTTETMTVKIIDFNHDDLSDGSGKAGISIAFTTLPTGGTRYSYPEDSTAYGMGCIWETSNLRISMNSGAHYNALPAELRAVLKSVRKVSNSGFDDNYNGGKKYGKNALYTTDDKVWLLSAQEAGLTEFSLCAEGQGYAYPYFQTVSNRKLKNSVNYQTWATRSMAANYSGSANVAVNGGTGAFTSNGGSAFRQFKVLGFCV